MHQPTRRWRRFGSGSQLVWLTALRLDQRREALAAMRALDHLPDGRSRCVAADGAILSLIARLRAPPTPV
jgi:hypothetical protein